MKTSRQKFIAFSCALLLQLALFASLLHAAEHPFHVQNDLCASFINFGQHDVSVDTTPLIVKFQVFSVEIFAENRSLALAAFHSAYSSRAPPAS